ncbi:MAG TPA: NADH-ubiquinone oxidoreductase-F iron-sulfur binding region domain-containing protein [Bacteroidales bacterium]|nr:formate dehydrogenase [Bacteroidales bacterium]HNR42860.1 NADH-ubiquinone oxidoreductase-F iron-sulfur binding region domain-containing protein [Bacteroidales bacterium]
MSRNLRGLSSRRGLTDSMYENIVRASADGDTRDEKLMAIADEFMTGRAAVLSSGSFYDFLQPSHYGKKVFVCDGTACLTSGKTDEIRRKLLETYREDEIGTMTCLGHCHSNNAILVNGDIRICGSDSAPGSINARTNAETPALIAPIGNIGSYYALADKWAGDTSGALKELELSGLRGRGGAGFPFHVKVTTARNTASDIKYVVCNGDEGDPGAFSDKWLLEERPHSVLFGMLMTGIITGAGTGVVYIRGEYPLAVKRIREAVRQLEDAGITAGPDSSDTGRFRFHVVEGSGAYICGEETSLLNSIEGLRAEVRTRPPFPAVYGLFGKPTVLSNVETFANIHFILREGGTKWASMGTEKSPGTKLVSLDGAFNRPGLLEVKMGTPLRSVIDDLGGGTRYPVKGFQIGGPLGGLVPAWRADDLTLDFESFAREGFLLGHAGIVSVPDDFPVIRLIEHLFEFTRKESCGKCFPCRLGSARGHELVAGAAGAGEKIDPQLFDDLLEAMELGSLCALGSGLPLPVKNALQYFGDELKEYFISKNA